MASAYVPFTTSLNLKASGQIGAPGDSPELGLVRYGPTWTDDGWSDATGYIGVGKRGS